MNTEAAAVWFREQSPEFTVVTVAATAAIHQVEQGCPRTILPLERPCRYP